jgi:hypothetical protein
MAKEGSTRISSSWTVTIVTVKIRETDNQNGSLKTDTGSL